MSLPLNADEWQKAEDSVEGNAWECSDGAEDPGEDE